LFIQLTFIPFSILRSDCYQIEKKSNLTEKMLTWRHSLTHSLTHSQFDKCNEQCHPSWKSNMMNINEARYHQFLDTCYIYISIYVVLIVLARKIWTTISHLKLLNTVENMFPPSLPPSLTHSRGKGWDHMNRFNPAISLFLFQTKTWFPMPHVFYGVQ
jgi:hypothetical protein